MKRKRPVRELIISLRFSQNEKALIDKAADFYGRPPAEFIRNAAMNDAISFSIRQESAAKAVTELKLDPHYSDEIYQKAL
jgi:uncharacterized protein (DUF1778 family)